MLTDIAGAEDHYGDMDFKVAGTRTGITALQMDIKVGGISVPLMRQALEQARKARLEILDIMDRTLTEHRGKMSEYAPRLFMLTIPTDKIRDLIGPGGKKIRSHHRSHGRENRRDGRRQSTRFRRGWRTRRKRLCR